MDTFDAAPLPPSLRGLPLTAMFIIMGFMIGTLLCLQWLYRIIDEMRDDPAPLRHPLTAVRAVKILFILAALSCAIPRMVLLMAWELMSPWWREHLALGSWLFYVVWAALLATAWWIDRVSAPVQRWQLRRVPAPGVVVSDTGVKTRGIIILSLIFVVAFATTYVRPKDVPSFQQHR